MASLPPALRCLPSLFQATQKYPHAMAAISTPGTPAKTSRFGTTVVVALVLVLAYQLAHWTWVFVAPSPVAAVPEGDRGVDMAAVAPLLRAAAAAPAREGAFARGL